MNEDRELQLAMTDGVAVRDMEAEVMFSETERPWVWGGMDMVGMEARLRREQEDFFFMTTMRCFRRSVRSDPPGVLDEDGAMVCDELSRVLEEKYDVREKKS